MNIWFIVTNGAILLKLFNILELSVDVIEILELQNVNAYVKDIKSNEYVIHIHK